MEILDKLEIIKNRWEEIGDKMNDPDVMSDVKRFVKLNKDYRELEPVVNAYKEYKNILANIENTKEVLDTEKDPEFREMAKKRWRSCSPKKRNWKKISGCF